METITIKPKNKKELLTITKVLIALDVNFEPSKSQYNPKYVKSILKGDQDFKNGECVTIVTENLWK